MEKIETLSSIEGRKKLQQLFFEVKFKKQQSTFSVLLLTWRICTSERELNQYADIDVKVMHPLGFFKGTSLWLQEIINRHYYSTINSFVYFGAAILLVLIGIRRFNENIDDSIVIAGVAFEALMLTFMFIVMFFSPTEEIDIDLETNGNAETKELIHEVGEVGRDLAATVIQIEQLNQGILALLNTQDKLLNKLDNISDSFIQVASPNPKMLEQMEKTNESLAEFNNLIHNINDNFRALKKEQIEFEVKKQLEKIISDKINFTNAETKAKEKNS